MTFRLSTKNLFLTYARCELEKTDVLNRMVELLDDYSPHIRVGRELHEDGFPHLHVFIRLERKLDTRSQHYFDLDKHHPNIVSRVRDLPKTLAYCSKENDFIDHGEPTYLKSISKWTAVAETTTAEEFWTMVLTASARDFVLNREKLEYYAAFKFKDAVTPYVSPVAQESFTINQFPLLQEWKDQAFNFEVNPITTQHTLCLFELSP